MRQPADRKTASRPRLIALCGNPNSGKTSIFNSLTGMSQQVGNYSGVTVEKVTGRFDSPLDPSVSFSVLDVPGTYSLSAFSPDEYIAAAALFGRLRSEPAPDAVICVIDATNLERSLYLLFQIMQIGLPLVVALNMVDLTERRGVTIDRDLLSRSLGGVAVVPVVGNKGIGIEELRLAVGQAVDLKATYSKNFFGEQTEVVLDEFIEQHNRSPHSRAEYLRVLFDEKGPAEKEFFKEYSEQSRPALEAARARIRKAHNTLAAGETIPLTNRAKQVCRDVVSYDGPGGQTRTEKIDKFLLHPILGPVILVALMVVVFQSIFSWAEPFMNLIDSIFGELAGIVGGSMAAGPLRSLLTDGVIGGVGSVLIFLPQIVILFLFMSLLEDSGYMARAAFLVDRMFRWCGLSGKSFIPMLSSFACAVPGIMATRTIEDRKLRLITIMVAPLMTCSARLPVYAIMIAAFIPYRSYFGLFNLQGLVLTALYILGLAVAILVSFVLKKTVMQTERGTFLMEMPSYKMPTWRSVLIRIANRVKIFVIRAGTVILAITIVIWVLSYYPRTDQLPANEGLVQRTQEGSTILTEAELANAAAGERLANSYFGQLGRMLQPAFAPLGWDWKITMSVLAAFPAREVIIATLGTIYNLGEGGQESSSLIEKMRSAKWADGAKAGQNVYTPAVALSIMVFFALCAQCGATLVTIKHETGSWLYPAVTFLYMTTLAYLAGMGTYQLFSRIWY